MTDQILVVIFNTKEEMWSKYFRFTDRSVFAANIALYYVISCVSVLFRFETSVSIIKYEMILRRTWMKAKNNEIWSNSGLNIISFL